MSRRRPVPGTAGRPAAPIPDGRGWRRVVASPRPRAALARGAFAPGSMGPKVESAVEFVAATGRPAVITTIGQVGAALGGRQGTTIVP